jgi:hypothetical protein
MWAGMWVVVVVEAGREWAEKMADSMVIGAVDS